MADNDWFAQAAVEAERSKVAKIAARSEAERAEKRRMDELIEEKRKQERAIHATNPTEAHKAAAVFTAVAEGAISPTVNAGNPPFSTGGGIPPRKVKGGIFGTVPDGAWNGKAEAAPHIGNLSPEAALGVILDHVRRAGSPEKVFAATGEWMGKVTNALSTIARASMPDEE